jgi:hypothetical protein
VNVVNEMKILSDARAKARRILDDLLVQQTQLTQDNGKIEPTQLAQGQLALANAITAARTALEALDDALAASGETQPTGQP